MHVDKFGTWNEPMYQDKIKNLANKDLKKAPTNFAN